MRISVFLIVLVIASSLYGQEIGNPNSGVLPDFVLTDSNGREFSSHQLKGKFVLIDFWASWCGPCHEKFPELKILYNELKDKGFEIVSVSTDRKKEAWLADLGKLNLPWIQVIDEQGDKSVATNNFAVVAIPTLFLIGPDGAIILKNPTDQQIREIVNNNRVK
ncbi:MAG: TlpA disulfide reductase family protein [Marinilabiliaceae bacterium]|jgi:thiol-disulfide isomerase/thioredoxin|nr:TlpA disulfide reductase family protein [Marinilabiliaceae bacterium]